MVTRPQTLSRMANTHTVSPIFQSPVYSAFFQLISGVRLRLGNGGDGTFITVGVMNDTGQNMFKYVGL